MSIHAPSSPALPIDLPRSRASTDRRSTSGSSPHSAPCCATAAPGTRTSDPFGSIRIPSAPFGSLRIPSTPFGSLRLPSAPFGSLWIPSDPFCSRLLPSAPPDSPRLPEILPRLRRDPPEILSGTRSTRTSARGSSRVSTSSSTSASSARPACARRYSCARSSPRPRTFHGLPRAFHDLFTRLPRPSAALIPDIPRAHSTTFHAPSTTFHAPSTTVHAPSTTFDAPSTSFRGAPSLTFLAHLPGPLRPCLRRLHPLSHQMDRRHLGPR